MRRVVLLSITTLAVALGGCASLNEPSSSAVADSDNTLSLPEELLPVALISFERPSPLPDPPPPSGPTDLWQRIRDGFALPNTDDDIFRRELAYFAARPGYLQRVAERARPYLHYIVAEIEDRHMPSELALLPIVESGFRPFAYSHGRAAGLWQFIPSTGRHYGLEQNWWYDGRRDVIAATGAALTYLEYLHEYFDGNWLLAIAAYNAGEGTVGRAIRRNERLGRPTDFWNLDLPSETETYVPRLLALRDLVRTPEVYGLRLPPLADEPHIEVVDIGSQIDLALAAELAGVSIEKLYRLNPGYNRWATAPSGPHQLVLPLDQAEAFRQELAATPEEQRVRWRRHEVQRGDTLSGIAKRHHTTIDVLRDVNAVSGSTIRVGEALVVPVASRPDTDYALSTPHRLAALQGRQRSGRRRTHVVNRGDTLWGISRRYGVSVRDIGRWNDVSPGDTLRPDQQLVIWIDKGSPSRWAEVRPGERMQSVRYTVRPGDSLYQIARQFNVSVADLRQWNGLATGSYLHPGQRLRLTVDVTAQSDI